MALRLIDSSSRFSEFFPSPSYPAGHDESLLTRSRFVADAARARSLRVRAADRRPLSSRLRPPRHVCGAEALEPRRLLSTFTVTTTDDAGPGSLRQAILDANALAGP